MNPKLRGKDKLDKENKKNKVIYIGIINTKPR